MKKISTKRNGKGQFIKGSKSLNPFPSGYKSPFSWSGKTFSEEHKKNLSEAHKGHKDSEETRLKKVATLTGRPVTEETRLKISLANSRPWTPLVNRVRHCIQYRQWRSDVFTRDDFICQECGERGGKLNADHIEPFSYILIKNNIQTFKDASECEELWNINNGQTLCVGCHQKTDTYGGYARTKKI